MRITEAAQRLGTSPRMLRYREALGLLPPTREPRGHRRFGEEELARGGARADPGEEVRRQPRPSWPSALRVLAEPDVRAAVRELGERIGRLSAPPARALDFEKEKALRLLRGRR